MTTTPAIAYPSFLLPRARTFISLAWLVGFSVLLPGAEFTDGQLNDPSRFMADLASRRAAAAAKEPIKLDPKRIINESNSFLKEREPEMTAEEYALYEKVVTMLASNPAFALKLLQAMTNEKEPPSPAFQFILGNAYYAAGEHAKSEENYRSAVKRYPNFLRAWDNLAILYYTTNRFAEAIPCFSKAIVLGDRESSTFGLLGYSLEQKGNIVSAEMAYMQALASDPANGDWKEGLLRIYIQGRQYGRAIWLVNTLISERPQESRFWFSYANILLADNRKLEALTILETAAGIGIARAEELELLGDLYAEQSLVPEAVAVYEKILQPSPQLGEQKLLHFAEVLIAAGKLAEAERALAAMPHEISPSGQINLLLARADLFAARHNWPESRRQLSEVLKLAPLNGRALLSLGHAYAEEDDVPHATFAFESAIQIPGSAYRASLELANIEIRNRHYLKSVEYLEKALSIEKSDTVADYLVRIKALAVKDGS